MHLQQENDIPSPLNLCDDVILLVMMFVINAYLILAIRVHVYFIYLLLLCNNLYARTNRF